MIFPFELLPYTLDYLTFLILTLTVLLAPLVLTDPKK